MTIRQQFRISHTYLTLAVRYKNGAWIYYKVSKHRKLSKLIEYFRGKADFQCASLFQTHKDGQRIGRLVYFNEKNTIF